MSNEYGLYDVTDYDQCVFFGTIKEIAQYLEYSPATLRSYLTRKKTGKRKLLARKYELIKINEDGSIEEKTEDKYGVFKELLELFRPSKIKFPIWDEREWKLKRITQ